MSQPQPNVESIADTTKPNAGRMYDYFLGGNHNFEIDRQAAEQVKKLTPFATKAVRLQRWCLQDIAERLTTDLGFDIIIDFASGLPTQDHIHQVVPAGTTVIYSDADPITVAYGREILKDVPNTYYFQVDCSRPEKLLGHPEVIKIVQENRKVALVYWGVSAFLTEEVIKYISQYLYKWASPESYFVFQAQLAGFDPNDPALINILKVYKQIGTPMYIRSLEEYQQMISPWHPDKKGFISLLDWHGLDQSEMSKEEQNVFGPGGVGYGAYLVK